MPQIVPIYAGLLGLVFIFLSVRVIRARRQERVALGDGGNPRLRRAIRVHANFAECVPLALILIAFAELQGQPVVLVHTLGLALLVGRLIHAFGVSQENETFRYRHVAHVHRHRGGVSDEFGMGGRALGLTRRLRA